MHGEVEQPRIVAIPRRAQSSRSRLPRTSAIDLVTPKHPSNELQSVGHLEQISFDIKRWIAISWRVLSSCERGIFSRTPHHEPSQAFLCSVFTPPHVLKPDASLVPQGQSRRRKRGSLALRGRGVTQKERSWAIGLVDMPLVARPRRTPNRMAIATSRTASPKALSSRPFTAPRMLPGTSLLPWRGRHYSPRARR